MIVVECPKCKQKYKVEEDYLIPVGGAPVRCSQCGNVFTIFIEPLEIEMIPISEEEYEKLSSDSVSQKTSVEDYASEYSSQFTAGIEEEVADNIETDFGGVSTTEEIEPVSKEELEVSRIEGEEREEKEITLGDITQTEEEILSMNTSPIVEEKKVEEEFVPPPLGDTALSGEMKMGSSFKEEEKSVDSFAPPPLMEHSTSTEEDIEIGEKEDLLPPPVEDFGPPPPLMEEKTEKEEKSLVEDDFLPPPPPLTPPPPLKEELATEKSAEEEEVLLPPPPPLKPSPPVQEQQTVIKDDSKPKEVETKVGDSQIGGIDFSRRVGVLSNASPEERAKNKARRLARSLVKDILLYKGKEVEEGYKNGTIKEILKDEIKKCYKYYTSEVNPEIVENETFFVDELNKIIGKGEKIWTKDEIKKLL